MYSKYIQMSFKLFKEYMEKNNQLNDYDRESSFILLKQYKSVFLSKDLPKYIKQYETENNQQLLYYMYTFTLKDNNLAQKAEQYIISIKNRQENLNIKKLAYTKEHIDSNLHFHVLIGSTRAIRTDAFKQYSQNYGFVNRSRKISETDIQIVDYLTKENDIIYLINP